MAGIDPISNVASAADGIIGTLGGLLEHFIPDAEKRQEAALAINAELLKQQGDENTGQIETNKIEAASSNVFVAGWRPYIGWVCGFALTWLFVLEPICEFVAAACHSEMKFPVLNAAALNALTFNLLGLAAGHSFDLYNGTAAPIVPVTTTKATQYRTNK